jgi:hypothetical protein
MELIIAGVFILIVGGLLIFRRKTAGETKVEEVTPYNVIAPTPAPDPLVAVPATKEVPVTTALDPVAVALDLEPLQIAEPAKKPRKPRAPKTVPTKVAKPKVAPKAKASPKAKSKKV